jgi:hypothetical protein
VTLPPGSEPELPAVVIEEVTPPAPEVQAETDPAANGKSGYKWVDPNEDWAYEWHDFEGDKLAVRIPTLQAVTGYGLRMSKEPPPDSASDETKRKYVAKRTADTMKLVSRHLSEESEDRVFDRMSDPDDPTYDEETIGQLMNQLIELQTVNLQPGNRAERRHPTSS